MPRPSLRFRAPIVLYPSATPVAGILYLGLQVASHPMWLVRPLVLTVTLGLLLTIALTLVLRDKHQAGLLAWAWLVGLFVAVPAASVAILAFGLVIAVAGLFRGRRPRPIGPRITSAMTVFSVVLLAATFIVGWQSGALQARIDEVAFDLANAQPSGPTPTDAADLYVLLLDGYPGASAADHEPTFDGDALPNALRARGFDVAADSRSNYLTTRLTLAAMFTGQYLDTDPSLSPQGTLAQDTLALRLATDGGVVLAGLAESGYERVAIASGYSEIGPNRVDRLIAPAEINELEWAMLRSTSAGRLVDTISPTWAAGQVRARVIETFDSAVALAAEPHDRPNFVFIHVPAPHAPWVTDEKGAIAAPPSGSFMFEPDAGDPGNEDRRRFFAYATWVGDLAIAALDRIDAASTRKPAIVVFSDHGPDFDYDGRNPLSRDLDLRTSNFVAVRTSDGGEIVPDDVSLANLFPRVLNRELGWDMPMLPDRYFAWPAHGSLLEFVELDPKTWKTK